MQEEQADLEEQIERCRRLRDWLTDEEMRDALEELAEAHEARLKRPNGKAGGGFMLRDRTDNFPRPAPRKTQTRMNSRRQQAIEEFKRILKWIVIIAVLMVVGALIYLYLTAGLDVNTVIATTVGVFFSVVLGCGLFAAAFFSDKSGIDQQVSDATLEERERRQK